MPTIPGSLINDRHIHSSCLLLNASSRTILCQVSWEKVPMYLSSSNGTTIELQNSRCICSEKEPKSRVVPPSIESATVLYFLRNCDIEPESTPIWRKLKPNQSLWRHSGDTMSLKNNSGFSSHKKELGQHFQEKTRPPRDRLLCVKSVYSNNGAIGP